MTVRLAALALVLSAFVGGSLGGCAERGRRLPADRAAEIVYVALGDSTVEGIGASSPTLHYVSQVHARLRRHYPAAQLKNLGVAGATSADVVAGQLEAAVSLRPTLLTLSVGPNDITERVAVKDYERNIETIFQRLVHDTTAVIVANLLPDLGVTPRFARSELREIVARQTVTFNEVLARAARKHGVEVVDLYRPSQREVPGRPELLASDGYHPSDVGYARWAELVWTGVEARMAPGARGEPE